MYLDSSWDLVDILRFNDGFQVIFKKLGEIILQLRTTEILEDLSPIWRLLYRKR